jgi:two-component system, LuxR family, sensor kinase FixL
VRLHKDRSRVDVAVTESVVDIEGNIEGICAIAQDIRERKRIEQQVAELTDAERQRIGHELHDALGQQLSAIGMIVTSVKDQLDDRSPLSSTLAKLDGLVDDAKSQLRTVAKGLVPVDLDASGLRVALEDLAREIGRVYKIDCHLDFPEALVLDNSFVATQLYLIAREAVHNAAKHADAKHVVIGMQDEEGLRLTVRDDGRGLDGNPQFSGGMGLHIMRHRSGLIGATLRTETADGGGTVVTCALPEVGSSKRYWDEQ